MRSSKPNKGKIYSSNGGELFDKHLSERADSVGGSVRSDQLRAYGEESDDDQSSSDNNDFDLGQSSDP